MVRPPLLRTPEGPCLCMPRRMQQSPAGNELHLTHLVLFGGHHDCLLSTQRPGVARAPNQSSRDRQSDQVTGQPPPPSPLAASQRPFRIQLSRAKRNLHGAGPHAIGSLFFLQIVTTFLQFIGEHYSAVGQDQLVIFETNDRMSTAKWKAVPSALDRNQPTTKFSTNRTPNCGQDPLTDRSSGVGPIHGIEP
jgi:hypothetical protein